MANIYITSRERSADVKVCAVKKERDADMSFWVADKERDAKGDA